VSLPERVNDSQIYKKNIRDAIPVKQTGEFPNAPFEQFQNSD